MRPVHFAQLLLLASLWGSAYLFMRASVQSFGAAPMIFLRLALGSLLVLLPLTLIRSGFGPIFANWRPILIMGAMFTAFPFLGLGQAALAVPAGLMAMLQSAAPIFAAIIGRLWLGERISTGRAVGLAVGLSGVAILVWDRFDPADAARLGILLTLGATVLWGVSAQYAKLRLSAIDPIAVATGSLTVAAVVLAPIAWVTWPQELPGARAWAEVLFLGIGSSGLGFLLYFSLLRSIGAVRATSVTFLTPVVATATAALYLGEPVTVRMLAGGAVILCGTALTLGLLQRAPRGGAAVPTGQADR